MTASKWLQLATLWCVSQLGAAGNMRASAVVSDGIFSTTPFPEEIMVPGGPCSMKMQQGYHVIANMHNCSHGGRYNLCLDCGDGVLAARAETCAGEVSAPEEAVKRCMADQMCEAVTVDQWKRVYYATESSLNKAALEALPASSGRIAWPESGYVTFSKSCKYHGKVDKSLINKNCVLYKWSGYRIASGVNDCAQNGELNLCHSCAGGALPKQEHTCDGEPESVHEALHRCFIDPACAAVTTDVWHRSFFVSEYAMQSATRGEYVSDTDFDKYGWPAAGYETFVKHCGPSGDASWLFQEL
mmetsp:Transcript_62519/g.116230  ORF Transcript_62519/g.116230 Transcript_62519/m.116230 type:complete len:300 (+) Transcript_62519:76-975(+)